MPSGKSAKAAAAGAANGPRRVDRLGRQIGAEANRSSTSQQGRDLCSPGSHPHADRPNWRPAETFDEYVANVREGLEPPSDRRLAALMGVSRIKLHRMRLMAEIPEGLFDRLLDVGVKTAKAFAAIAQAMRGGEVLSDTDTCPHCGGVLRVRQRVSDKAIAVVNDWLAEGRMIDAQWDAPAIKAEAAP